MTKKFNSRLKQKSLLWAAIQIGVLVATQDLTEVLQVRVNGVGKDENIVKINNTDTVDKFTQGLLKTSLMCCLCIRQTHGHHNLFD